MNAIQLGQFHLYKFVDIFYKVDLQIYWSNISRNYYKVQARPTRVTNLSW